MSIRRSLAVVTASGAVLLGLFATAEPVSAVSSCIASTSPKMPVGYSSLAVGCVIDISPTPASNATGLEVHDALNAAWHRGAARTATVTVTPGSATFTYASGAITTADIRRPISGTGIAGGAFIVTAGTTSGTLSQKSTGAAAATITSNIEHTNARILSDVKYPVGGATSTITSATAVFIAADVNRSVTGGGFGAGARISAVTNATTAVVTPGTAARAGQVLTGNGTRTAATKNITGWTGLSLLNPSDVGATVTGTGIPAGATIAAVVSGTAFTLSANATTSGTSPITVTGKVDVLTIGATKYAAAYPSLSQTSSESTTRQMSKTTGVSCASGVLTSTTSGGGFATTDVGLPVQYLNIAAIVAGAWKVTANTTTTATLSPLTCPTTWTHLAIGKRGTNAPENADVMALLGASLNVNPDLVSSVDDCRNNTYEGFQFAGRWQNPGGYVTEALIGNPPANSVAQIVFDTSLVSFAAYVVPVATSDAAQAGPHYDVVFPSLPTSNFSVTCPLSATVTTNRTALSLDFSGTVAASRTTVTAAGAGNPSTASVRAIGSATGAFGPKVVLKNGLTTLATLTPPPCTIAAATVAPDFACGTG